MSKFLTKFQAAATYNTAKDNLDKPNVSLVTEENAVHYAPSVINQNS